MNAPAPKITPRALLLKPRDWQQIAQRQASDMLGTPEAAEKLAEARRYGALADELEHLQASLHQMAALFGVPSASPAELVALVRRAIADRDDALAAESIAQLAAEAAAPDSIRRLIVAHADLLDQHPHCYFELAWTRSTGWMAWLTDKPAQGEPGTAEFARSRTVLARGQGDSADEACRDALAALASRTD